MGFARIDATDAAWLLLGAAIALLTAPALALLYGDASHRRNVTVALLRALSAIPIVAVQWLLFGYSLAFGSSPHGIIGGFVYAGTSTAFASEGPRSAVAVIAFRMVFALAMPALIAGAFAERMRFRAYVAFVVCWSTIVFDPIAHWVWSDGGWLGRLGVLDYAGGTVVHLTAGVAALVCIAVIGKPRDEVPDGGASAPEDARDVLAKCAGAGLLWVAYTGFNVAGALPSARLASLAFVTTQLGAAAGGLGWLAVEWHDRGRVRPVGVALGVVAGLIAIAPAAGYVSPSAAIAIGFIGGAVSYGTALGAVAGLSAALLAITAEAGYVAPTTAVVLAVVAGCICYGAVMLRERFGAARMPDAFGIHAVAGIAGVLLTGVFAQKALNGRGADGALFGNSDQAAVQLLACVVAALYTSLVTLVILKLIDATIGLGYREAPQLEDETADRGEVSDVTGVRERRLNRGYPNASESRAASALPRLRGTGLDRTIR